jgi:hypothetical protein
VIWPVTYGLIKTARKDEPTCAHVTNLGGTTSDLQATVSEPPQVHELSRMWQSLQ